MFSFNRFMLLLRRFFALRRRDLTVNSLVMLGIAVVLLGISLAIGSMEGGFTQDNIEAVFAEMQRGMFATYVLISGSVFASMVFSEFGERTSASTSLMLPATALEKWLAAFALSTVYFLASVTAAFYVAELANIAFFNAARPIQLPFSAANGIFQGGLFGQMLGGFAATHAIYFLGSIHFKKEHWWRTTLVLMAGATVFGLVEWFFSSSWPTGVHVREQMGLWVVDVADEGSFRLPVSPQSGAKQWLAWLVPPVLWALSYLKLTEKQA